VTFWFRPIGDDGSDHDWARAIGMIPVQVPTCRFDAPDGDDDAKEIKYIAMGTGTQTVTAYVTGRGTLLPDIYVGLSGASITDKNTTTGSIGSDLGRASFTITPGQTGNITIDVGADGRTVVRPLMIVTNWELECSAPIEVNEGTDEDPVYFTVTVTDKASGLPVEGADVTATGIADTVASDASGEAVFESLTGISADRTLTITAEKDGYKDSTAITITVVDIPNLIISLPSKITAGKSFDVVVAKDNGDPVIGATVTVSWDDTKSYTSGDDIVTIGSS